MGNSNSKTTLPTYPNLLIENFPKDNGESITLSDDRKLGYMEYNFKHYYDEKLINPKEKEHVILLIPGLPEYRQPSSSNAPFVTIKLYVLERPGIGLSTFANRNFLDFTEDIKEFCLKKKINHCSMIAYSAGGPYGLAAAHELGVVNNKDKNPSELPLIKKLATISSTAPYSAPNITTSMPWKLKIAWWLTKNCSALLSYIARMEASNALKDPVKSLREGSSNGPVADKEIIETFPGVEPLFIESILEMYTRGQVETECWEYSLWGKDWGFELKNIGKNKHREHHDDDGDDSSSRVKCKAWHGEGDIGTTVEMSKYIAEQIEGCESSFVEKQGHLLYFTIWYEGEQIITYFSFLLPDFPTDKADDEFDKIEKLEDSLVHIEDEESSSVLKM
ncbi:15246_t:CDS:2 [Entrophospora sp. SA101]|nr:1928_t:CDS:2 [Entrophospora sp. SA101]CAJ0914040.1 15246_t:CDS:2 [Entrophospora sp. SA101]